MSEGFLTAETVEGKLQQLIGHLVEKPAEEIDNSFDFKAMVTEDRADYFDKMIAETLTTHFDVPSEPRDIDPMRTVQDILDYINIE